MFKTTFISVSNSKVLIQLTPVSEGRIEPPTVIQYPWFNYIMSAVFCQSAEHSGKHLLKIYGEFFRSSLLSVFGKLLLCPEMPPLIPYTMLVLTKMLQSFTVILFAYHNNLPERSIFHKSTDKKKPVTIMKRFLFTWEDMILLCDRLRYQVLVIFKVIPRLRLIRERTAPFSYEILLHPRLS